MTDIAKIDKNFAIETNVQREKIKFYDAKSAPIKLYGVWHDGEGYRRVPKDVAERTSEGLVNLAMNTAGGRIRFVTDSPYVVLKVIYPNYSPLSHMPKTGSAGFDLYVNENGRENFKKVFIPLASTTFDGVHDFPDSKERLITINFPLYNKVNEVYVGVHEDYTFKAAPDYTVNEPMVFYGSSITQGGCASRPGNAYQGFVSRRYDADFINLGFSGNAKGEDPMREYIKTLPMSAFILDYDFNAPTDEHLLATHKPLYEAVRENHPDVPIIMMARPVFFLTPGVQKRNDIIKATYDYARANGDENVYFIPSEKLMALCEDGGTVDGTHPTDLGFKSMALAVTEVLDGVFKVVSNQ